MLRKVREYIKIAKDTGFFYIMMSNILTSLFGFFSGILWVRIISKGEYGVYSYANNLLSYFLLFTGLGLSNGTFQLCCENNTDKEKMHAIYRYGYSRGIMVNAAMAAIIIVYSQVSKFSIPGAEFYLFLMAFLPIVTLCFEFTGIYFRSDYRNKAYAAVYILNAAMASVVSVLGALKFGAAGIVLSSYLGPIFSILVITTHTDLKERRRSPSPEKRVRIDIWKISLVSMASNAIRQMMYLVDVSMIGVFIQQEEEIASYRVGVSIPTAVNFIPMAIITYVYPYFVSHMNDMAWTKRMARKLFAGACVLFGTITLGAVLLADFIVPVVFGVQYRDAIPIFRILCVSSFFESTFRIIFGNLLSTQRKFTFNLLGSIISGIINIIGDYFFIRKFGTAGVAFTTLIVMACCGIMSAIYYWHVLNKKERSSKRID